MSLFNSQSNNLESIYYQEIRPKLFSLHGKHQQYGSRASRTLAEHLDSACQFVITISKLAGVPENKRRVLVASAAVHDLNKLNDANGRNVKTLARNRDFLLAKFAEARVDRLIETEEDIELARKLIERHSGHNVSDGSKLFPEDDEIEQWASILRAADLFDLELEEEQLVRKIRAELVCALNRSCELYRVKITENQGYITSLLLAATEEVLDRHNYHILALFSDGALIEGAANPRLDLTKEIAIAWQEKIDSVFGGNIEKLVKATKDGIKISPQAVKHDRTEVLDTVLMLLEKKKAGFKADKVNADIDKWGNQKIDDSGVLTAALSEGLIPIETAEDFKISEGMKSAYLSYRKADICPSETWNKICHHAGLSESQRLALEPFDPQYARCLFAAKAASNGIEGIINAIDESLNLRVNSGITIDEDGDEEENEIEVSEERIEAVKRAISLPFVKKSANNGELIAYINAKPKERSSLGATINKAIELNAPEMPVGTQVQKFSNRLVGGKSDAPKRSGEPTVSLAYQLMTVGGYLPNKCKEPPYYAHFLLPEGSSPALLGIWRDWLMSKVPDGGGGTQITVDELALYRDKKLAFKPNKVVGLGLPKRTDFVYSTIPIPITWGDTNASIALLKSLRLTLELALAPELGFPFILTAGLQIDSSTNVFGRVEGIPSTLQTLLSNKSGKCGIYNRTEATEIRDRLRWLGELAVNTVSFGKLDDCLYDLARGCAQPLSLYFILLRWILREKDDPNFSVIWRKIKQPLQNLLDSLMTENQQLTNYLKQAATIGAEAKLRGNSFKRTSLVEPFSEFITAVRSQKSYMDLDFMFAALAQKYHTRLDRIREHGVGATKLEQIKSFYDVLRKIYEEIYQSRADKLLNDRSNLEAAYLFFLQEEIDRLKAKDKKDKDGDNNEES